MALRAATSGLIINLGMVSMVGNLYTPEATESKKAAKFKNCCKQCYDADKTVTTVNNQQACIDGEHGVLTSDDIIKGKEVDGGEIIIVGTAEEVKEVKAESVLELKKIDLAVHKADEVDAALFPGEGAAYPFLPTGDNEFYHVLMALMDDDGRVLCDDGEDRVLIGGLRVRDTDHLVRLTKWNGHLVVKIVLRPEQLKEFPVIEAPDLSDKSLAMGRMLIALETDEFDPENYRDENRKRLADWISARQTGVTITPAAPKAKGAKQDLDAMLEAAVAMAKAKATG